MKNINLRIRSDGSIHLSASKSVPIERIESFMKEKSTFILSGLEKIKARRPLPTKEITYETGDVFMIGGVEYFLVVEIGEKNQVVLEENKIILTQKLDCTTEKKQQLVEDFLWVQYGELLMESCKRVYSQFSHIGIPFPQITMRRMTSRWGSCNPSKCKITLNRGLGKAPISCIDYVVAHEFTHFIHQDHSPNFYKSLAGYYPNWKQEKEKLNEGKYL